MSETVVNESTLGTEKIQTIDVDEEIDKDDLIIEDEICDDSVESTTLSTVLDSNSALQAAKSGNTGQAEHLNNSAFTESEHSKEVELNTGTRSFTLNDQDDCEGNNMCFEDNYKVKVARIPRNVLEHMIKFEEDDVVRINVTQMNFFCSGLKRMGRYVLATKWEDSELPVINLRVPNNAHKYKTLIVRTFQSELNDDEDKRLENEHQERVQRYMIKKKQSINMDAETIRSTEQSDGNIQEYPAAIPGVAQILPAEGCTDMTTSAIQQTMSSNQRRKQIKLLRKKLYKEGQTSANDDKSAHDDIPLKQARTERLSKHSSDDYALRTFPKKNVITKSTPSNQKKIQPNQNIKKKLNQNLVMKQGSPIKNKMNVHNHRDERNRTWKEKSRRPRNEVPILSTSAFGFDRDPPPAPWVSGPVSMPAPASMGTSELVQLESLMRRAVYENSSTIATANHIERLGLGSAMGAVLNAVGSRASNVTPTVPSMFPSSVSGIDITPSSNINDYVRKRGSSPYRDRLENYGYNINRGDAKRDGKREKEPNDDMDMSKFVEPLDAPCRSNYGREHYKNHNSHNLNGYGYGTSSLSVRTQGSSYTKPLLSMSGFPTQRERFNITTQPSSLVHSFSQDTTYGSNISHDDGNVYSSSQRQNAYARDKYHDFGGDYKRARGNGGSRNNRYRKSRSGR